MIMFSLSKKYHQIQGYNDQYAISGNDKLIHLEDGNFITIENPRKLFALDRLLVLDNLNVGYWIYENGDIEIISNEFRINGVSSQYLSFYKYGKHKENGVFSINEGKILFSTEDYLGRDILEDKIIADKTGGLSCRSVRTGKLLWEVSFEKYGSYFLNGTERSADLQKIIGCYLGVVFIKVGNRLIVGLNMETGNEELKVRYEEPELVLENLFIDVTNGTIISLGPNHFFELDIHSGKYELTNIINQVNKHGIRTTKAGSLEGDIVSFWEGSTNNRFGLFNKRDKTIEWTQEIPEVAGMFPAIRSVKHHQGFVYVHDHNMTLTIFSQS